MDLEERTNKNTDDINKVTKAVAELTVTMRFEMERGKEERDSIKSVLIELRGINEKMGSLTTVQNEVSELKGEMGKYRHDLRNLESLLQALPLIKKDVEENTKNIAVLQTKDDTCKEWRDKHDGATKAMSVAVRAMWAVCGTGVLSVASFVLYLFFTSQQPVLMRHIGKNDYVGRAELSGD